MHNLYACSRCGDWPDVSYELEGARWCGTCAPWSRSPSPLGPLIELGRRASERLGRQGRTAARSDVERVVAWLEGAAAGWPGADPWRTVRLATQLQHRLMFLERKRPKPRQGDVGRQGDAGRPRASARKLEAAREIVAGGGGGGP